MEIQKLNVTLGTEKFATFTSASLPSWKLIEPSVQLLAMHARISGDERMLLFGSHQGPLAVYLTHMNPHVHLTITDLNNTAIKIAKMTVEANHLNSVNYLSEIDLPEEYYEHYDAVFIQLPKGRSLVRRWLLQAYHALGSGCILYLAGANQTGVKSANKDAGELFGPGQIQAYKKGNRIALFTKETDTANYPEWVFESGIAPHTWIEFSITVDTQAFTIRSLPGVFSADHLDEGTEMLLKTVQIHKGASVLDVGCGYGVIGMVAASRGAGLVHLCDNNLLAAAACRETLALNHIGKAEVFVGELLSPVNQYKYDQVLSNPPFHTGQAVNYQVSQELIRQAYQVLNPGGQLMIVANRFIQYDRLISEVFGNCSSLADSGKFHVLSGLKSS